MVDGLLRGGILLSYLFEAIGSLRRQQAEAMSFYRAIALASRRAASASSPAFRCPCQERGSALNEIHAALLSPSFRHGENREMGRYGTVGPSEE